MRYSVDTNALIDGWHRWYTPATHPTLWDNLDALAQAGHLKISDTVLWELEEQEGDALYHWCKAREVYLCAPSVSAVQKVVRTLGGTYPNLGGAVRGSKNYADPFVIALARLSNGCTVVTHEQATNNINGPRIPDVCRKEGVRVLRLHQLIAAEGWRFT